MGRHGARSAVAPWDDPLSIRYLEVMKEASELGLDLDRLFHPDLPDHERLAIFDWFRAVHQSVRIPMAYAIPTAEAVHIIGQFSPIVEIGAGSGYWSRLIRERTGSIVFAYDKSPCLGVHRCDHIPTIIESHPDCSLFLCWPDQSDMASTAINAFGGEIFIYIGESIGRTVHGDFSPMGDVAFHLYVNRHFHEVLRVPLPNWPGNQDCLSVYKRSGAITLMMGETGNVETFQHVPPSERSDLFTASELGWRILDKTADMIASSNT